MRLVFAGTPVFAARVLKCILDVGHQVLSVYTQPDRPAGRGRRLTPSPVKRLALERGLTVYQPVSLRGPQAADALLALAPDVMVVAAYGLLLPPAILCVPRLGCLNVHASLLPRWRGAAPIQRAILAGDEETGVCIMRMQEGLDTGPVLAQRRCTIAPNETAGSLHDALVELGCEALVETLAALESGVSLSETPQDDARATYASRIEKGETRIAWERDATALERQVRAFHPSPTAWTTLPEAAGGARLRVLRARVETREPTGAPPGQVLTAGRNGVTVACGHGALRLLELQLAGRRPMSAADFLNANVLKPGDRLS